MARSSSRVALALLVLVQSGCWTGTLLSSARQHESVLRYDRFSIDDNEIRLEYTVEISADPPDVEGSMGKTRRRAAVLALAELDARPAHPVDSFPFRRVQPNERAGDALPTRLRSMTPGDSRDFRVERGRPATDSMTVEIAERKGRHVGFRLCPEVAQAENALVAAGLADAESACHGTFYSAALYDDPLAWWIYPAAPFAIAFDLVLFPIQLLTLPPMLVLSD